MIFEFEKKDIFCRCSLHLLILQRFDILYEISIEEHFIKIKISDDYSSLIYMQYGAAVKLLETELDRLFQELQWPLKKSE